LRIEANPQSVRDQRSAPAMTTIHTEARKVEARTDTRASSVVVAIVMVSALCGAFAIDTASQPSSGDDFAVAAE
jgi:hypothetical protein